MELGTIIHIPLRATKCKHDLDSQSPMTILFEHSKAESTPRAELSGADDVNKTREGRETQKSSFRPGRVLLLGLPPLPPLVDVVGAGKLSSWRRLSFIVSVRQISILLMFPPVIVVVVWFDHRNSCWLA